MREEMYMNYGHSLRSLAPITVMICAAMLLLLASPKKTIGQQGTTPQRGFEPGGSYALSNIESVNTINGDVMLNFPFKLPPGRGGFAAQLGLHYDSKNLDSFVRDYLQPGVFTYTKRSILGQSELGGWHYGLGYGIKLVDLWLEQGTSDDTGCPDTHIWQVKIALPDGSLHEMIPSPQWNFSNGGDGFYNIRPGQQAFCRGQQIGCDINGNCTYTYTIATRSYATGTITYHSFDGTYMRLDWSPDGSWTLYLADGTRVTSAPSGGQRILDRNGNYADLTNITYNGHPATQLIDQMGRTVIVEYQSASGQDTVHVSGTGGAPLVYQVKGGTINVNKTYQPEYASGGGASGEPATLYSLPVVSEIDLPPESGGLKYLFGYNAPYDPDQPTAANGWGELSSITLPSGAQVHYNYALDGQ